jgi:hypothetical protein
MVQEIEQQIRAASPEAQMNVRYEDRAQSQSRRVAMIHHVSLPKYQQNDYYLVTIAICCYGSVTRRRRFAYKKWG